MFNFRDDYSDGAHPEILRAITEANTQLQTPYGADEYTKGAEKLIQEKMNSDSAVHFVASGTMANLLAIGSCLRPHEAVIAAHSGHIATHETGAIEATGHKVITVTPVKGKLTPKGISQALAENGLFPHMAKPRLVYISNATEVGTLYDKAELKAIHDLCRSSRLLLFLDGARLGVALSAEKNDLTLKDLGTLTDIFWIGGTKVGAMFGEAIVINTPKLREDFKYHIKQRGALLPKGRYLGAQFQALFRSDLYFAITSQSNHKAKVLSAGIKEAGYSLAEETATNQVFAIFPDNLIKELQNSFTFHVWQQLEDSKSMIRLVTSWSTEQSHIDAFLGML